MRYALLALTALMLPALADSGLEDTSDTGGPPEAEVVDVVWIRESVELVSEQPDFVSCVAVVVDEQAAGAICHDTTYDVPALRCVSICEREVMIELTAADL